jgi:hypothetical protein
MDFKNKATKISNWDQMTRTSYKILPILILRLYFGRKG